MAEAAREYVSAGLHILALTGKRPNGRVHGEGWSWEDSFHGHPTDADVAVLEQMFSEDHGTTGIAILIPPNFYVADVDSDRAAQLLLDLGFEAQDDSVCAETKNGLHVWFWMPGANRNRWLGDGQQPDPVRTLLFKGLGGYVVAPPSLHFDADGEVDGAYQWANSLVVGGAIQMPDLLPKPIRDRFAAEDQFTDTLPAKDTMTTFRLEPVEGLQWWQWPKVWDYQTFGLERAIETAADGNQNAVIHWAACVCRDEGVPFNITMERLLAAAIRGNHPKNRARDTIKGVFKRSASA